MYRRIIQSTLLLSLAAVGTACGSDNELSGSISESFSLDFDRTEVRYLVTTNELTIQYLRDLGNTTSKPVKVVVDATDLTLGEDTRISGDVFAERVVIQREAETGGDFPEPNGDRGLRPHQPRASGNDRDHRRRRDHVLHRASGRNRGQRRI